MKTKLQKSNMESQVNIANLAPRTTNTGSQACRQINGRKKCDLQFVFKISEGAGMITST